MGEKVFPTIQKLQVQHLISVLSVATEVLSTRRRAILPGLKTLNWTSLGLQDFVSSCLKSLTAFKATCEQVFKNVEIIEQIVQEIETSELVRDINWESFTPFNIQVGF